MRPSLSIVAIFLLAAVLAVSAFAGSDSSVDAPTISCGNGVPGGVNCIASKKDLKQAHNAYTHGLKLGNHGQLEEALVQFNDASRLVPQDTPRA